MRTKTLESTRLRVADDITQLVGETPLLRLKSLTPPGSADVYAKLEYLNPGGSVKDRAAIGIIRRAEEQGLLRRGGTIVEATAGNTGIGLALIGVNRGYKVVLFVPERYSEEKVIIMRALGAQVIRTPESEGLKGAIQRAKEKTEQMQARAGAIDELVQSGALEDFTSDQTDLDRQLGQLASQSQVDDELAKMKAELGSGEKKEISAPAEPAEKPAEH